LAFFFIVCNNNFSSAKLFAGLMLLANSRAFLFFRLAQSRSSRGKVPGCHCAWGIFSHKPMARFVASNFFCQNWLFLSQLSHDPFFSAEKL